MTEMAMETRTDSVRSYRTRFQQDEHPISEGGIWLNGARDGIDWADVIVRNGVAYGSVTRMQAAERRVEQGNLSSADPGAAPEGDYDDPTALLAGAWGKNQHATATVFSKNRERLLAGDIAQAFFDAVGCQARQGDLLSDEHFTVDGTLLEAWASKKSYQKKDEPPEQGSGSRGGLLLRDTHESKSDPDAQMYRKSTGGEFKLCHMAHVLMENRHGLAVAGRVTTPLPQSEWEAALEMVREVTGGRGATLGADKAYDEAGFIAQLREMKITPHVAQYAGRRSNIDGRTTRHPGYGISLSKRKSIEQIFGWLKNTGLLRKLRHRGRALVQWSFTLALSAYNLVRMRTLTVSEA